MLDGLKNMAGDVLQNDSGSVVDTILGATDLDDKVLEKIESEFGKEKVDAIKAAIADGKVDAHDIANVATEFGVPEIVIETILKFANK